MTWHRVVVLLLQVGTLLAGRDARAASVVILRNTSQTPYREPSALVEAKLRTGHTVSVFDIGGASLDAAKGIAASVVAKKPALVVTFGDKAAYVAKNFIPNVPVVFGLVANWEAIRFDRGWATGVGDALEPETVCSQINTFFPGRRRIGIIYSNTSKQFVERAMKKASLLKMTIVPGFTTSGEGFISTFRNMAKNIDLFWLIQDPTLITKENIATLAKEAAERKLPTVAYSTDLVKAGLFMSITVNTTGVGRQMASIAEQILGGKKTDQVPIAAPEAAAVAMNATLIGPFGLKFDQMLLDFVELIKK